MVIIAVMFPVANTISSLVKEKELRIKEGLKMMGLTGLAHTASWVVHFTCLFFFVSLFMVGASGTLFENRQAVPFFLLRRIHSLRQLEYFWFWCRCFAWRVVTGVYTGRAVRANVG